MTDRKEVRRDGGDTDVLVTNSYSGERGDFLPHPVSVSLLDSQKEGKKKNGTKALKETGLWTFRVRAED